MSIRRMSITLKFLLILLLTVALIVAAGFIAAHQLRTAMLRKTAQAVTEQLVAFRSWVSETGMIWVDGLRPEDPDFLLRTTCGQKTFYSKNPAIATRELSRIIAKSGVNVTFRATSDNFRNASNEPDAFELSAIRAFKAGLQLPPQQQAKFVETFQRDRYRYSVPIIVTEGCLKCHGEPEKAPREIVEKYGAERAFHYHIDDIRGVITVDLPITPLLDDAPILNWWSLVIILLAFVINFLLFKKIVIERIEAVTRVTEDMVQKEFTTDLGDRYKKDSNDEIDKLYAVLDTMGKGMKSLLEKLKANR